MSNSADSHIFVCYSHADSSEVTEEVSRLESAGLDIWFDSSITAGSEWSDELARHIQTCRHFLYFLSPESAASENCRRELTLAQTEGRNVVVVELRPTELPPGLKLALGNRQIVSKHKLSNTDYAVKLQSALNAPVAVPSGVQTSQDDQPADLRRLRFGNPMVLVTLALLILLGGYLWFQATGSSEDITLSQSLIADGGVDNGADEKLVVLPFEILSSDPEDAYLAAGLSEELMTNLASVPGLSVVPRTSAQYFRDNPADLKTIQQMLNVDYVIEGSLRFAGGDLRMTARLLNAHTGKEIDTLVMDRRADNLLELQSDLAVAILGAMGTKLSASEVRTATAAGTTSEEAFRLYLKAIETSRRDEPDIYYRSAALYQSATELDPQFKQAYFGWYSALRVAHVRSGKLGDFLEKIQQVKDQYAAKVGDNWLHNETIRFEATSSRDWQTLERNAREMIRNGEGQYYYWNYASSLAFAGLFEASAEYYRLAIADDPFQPIMYEYYGLALMALDRKQEALKNFERCLRMVPDSVACNARKRMVMALLGRSQELDFPDRVQLQMDCLDPTRMAEHCDPPAIETVDENTIFPFFSGMNYLRAGRLQEGFALLNEAADRPLSFINEISTWAAYGLPEETRNDPRFKSLEQKIGLTDEWRREMCRRAQTLTPTTGVAVTCI